MSDCVFYIELDVRALLAGSGTRRVEEMCSEGLDWQGGREWMFLGKEW